MEDASAIQRRTTEAILVIREARMSTLKVNGAAERLGLSVSTLNKWRTQGRGPSFVKLGRSVCYRTEDLDAWLNDHVRSSTSEYGGP